VSYVPPTNTMDRYARSLLSERQYPEFGVNAAERLDEYQRRLDTRTLDKFELMGIIDYLKVAPLDTKSGLPIGVYRRNGEIFVVKLNRAKTNKYVSRLVELTGSARRLNEPGDHVPIDFEYAPGMLAQLRPEDQMSLEEAKPYIIRYGRCLFCGQFLRAAKSVERAVGPVCFKRYRTDNDLNEPTPEVSSEVKSDLAALLAKLGG
jgi:hypothetical protein